MPEAKMKAIICSKYGPPEVLNMAEIEKPIPKKTEVLVKIHATTVSIGDSRIRGFRVPLSFWIPARLTLGLRKPNKAVLGSVFAGEIEAVGSDVQHFSKGDHVFGSTGHNLGAYAEYICIPENGCLSIKPIDLTYEEAAAIPWGGNTALYFLRKGDIRKDQKVLIYGASGSVGSSAVQIAKYFGAEVTGVCSTDNLDMVKSLGADEVIDYKSTDFTRNGEKYDVIFDTVGKSPITGTINSLKSTGIYIHAMTTPATEIRIRLGLMGSKKKMIGGTFSPNAEFINYLKKLVEDGHLKPVIDRIYPMAQMVDAHRYVDKGHKKGNVIITIN